MMTPGEQPAPIELSEEVQARIRELQAVITDAQRRADKTDDEDIREALNLQISNIGLRVARLRRGLSEEIPPKEVVPEDEIPPLPQPTETERVEADMLVQRAMLEKRRGNKQAALDLLKQAVDKAPGSATVLEALADDLAENRRWGEAEKAYRDARRQDPANASIERKLAQLSMSSMSNLSFEDQLRLGNDPVAARNAQSMANPKVAVILSCMLPGLGQMVMGYTKKGVTILVLAIICIIVAVVLARAFPAPKGQLPMLAVFFGVAALVTYIVGIFDASSAAKRTERHTTNRPVPPANLPFE
jgi:tetratricopeptide (TPR) repeat protein